MLRAIARERDARQPNIDALIAELAPFGTGRASAVAPRPRGRTRWLLLALATAGLALAGWAFSRGDAHAPAANVSAPVEAEPELVRARPRAGSNRVSVNTGTRSCGGAVRAGSSRRCRSAATRRHRADQGSHRAPCTRHLARHFSQPPQSRRPRPPHHNRPPRPPRAPAASRWTTSEPTMRAPFREHLSFVLAAALASWCADGARAQTPPPSTPDEASAEPAAEPADPAPAELNAEQQQAHRDLSSRAIVEFEAGRFAEARALFMRAHEIWPSARTFRVLGMTSFELRSYVRALQELKPRSRTRAGSCRSTAARSRR